MCGDAHALSHTREQHTLSAWKHARACLPNPSAWEGVTLTAACSGRSVQEDLGLTTRDVYEQHSHPTVKRGVTLALPPRAVLTAVRIQNPRV